jgi:hypothetical protein
MNARQTFRHGFTDSEPISNALFQAGPRVRESGRFALVERYASPRPRRSVGASAERISNVMIIHTPQA